jgi:hypothetical protein
VGCRFRDGEWTQLPSWFGVTRGQLFYSGPVATDDSVWVGCRRAFRAEEAGCEGLLRFDGTAWHPVAPPPEWRGLSCASSLAVGPDGTLWAHLEGDWEDDYRPLLARLREDPWSVHSPEFRRPLVVGA